MKDRVGYTEFSYGYAFTENLIRSSSSAPTAAPHFPNLVQEGSLGYDVRIDQPAFPLFFQFKLPELMVGKGAAELRVDPLTRRKRTDLTLDFFRMPVTRNDPLKTHQQHQMLIDLEADYPGAVFYASGAMANIAAFNTAYIATAVPHQSALFSPSDIGALPDNDRHVVSYNAGAHHAWFCSEPKKIKLITFEALLADLEAKLASPQFADFEAVIRRVHGTLTDLDQRRADIDDVIFVEAVDGPGESRKPVDQDALRQRFRASLADGSAASPKDRIAEELFVTREIARIDLGLEMIIAQPGN